MQDQCINHNAILFIINGLGLGNSTRCDALIQEFVNDKWRVDVATSGNGISYFEKKTYITELLKISSFFYGVKNNNLSILRTFLAIPIFVCRMIRNANNLYSILKKNNYRGIVIDSEYSISLLQPFIRTPIIAINNADLIISEVKKLGSVPTNIWPQLLIENMDFWFHQVIPDLVLSPVFLEAPRDTKKIKHIGPIIRNSLKSESQKAEPKNILVMLSGSQFHGSHAFLHKLERIPEIDIHVLGESDVPSKHLHYYGKTFDQTRLLVQADIMIINGGFSAVSEALILRKPVIIIPVKNHAEQFINAHIMERAGLGIMTDTGCIDLKLRELIERYQEFISNHKARNFSKSDQLRAKSLIMSFLNKNET